MCAFVNVDKTKLDGIEASADVTDTANVTAAGALMDSEVNNLAQVKAFDSADYATAAQGVTADAALARSGGTMTGSITFAAGQTFDGRDVSADGAKLDGIEANATADQTKADIDALGINADQVDGLDASQFVRSDASDTMSGALSITQSTSATPTLTVANTGLIVNDPIIARFEGDSDAIIIQNFAGGDYQIINTQQNNGIALYDGSGGV